jgi:hypothetical protein
MDVELEVLIADAARSGWASEPSQRLVDGIESNIVAPLSSRLKFALGHDEASSWPGRSRGNGVGNWPWAGPRRGCRGATSRIWCGGGCRTLCAPKCCAGSGIHSPISYLSVRRTPTGSP